MPRQGRKITKHTSGLPICTPVKDSSCVPLSATSSKDYRTLKRAQLQQQCKKLGLRALGKNTELIERLEAYHEESSLRIACNKEETNKPEEKSNNLGTLVQTSPPNMTKDIKTETSEDKTDMVRGWCVVHGMVLSCPASSWVPLLLHRGLVYIQDGENLVPFHLSPMNISVPEGLLDNYVCMDCVLRNQEKPKKCPMCQQIQRKNNRVYTPQSTLKNLSPLMKTSPSSLFAIDGFKEKKRTVEIKKLYQPQEDQVYAQRVDGLLSKMARGEIGMDRALCPLQSLVVHSPAPYET
ncbi:uncharacterized protein LOC131198732 [Ahaetulla prasina]|uniref:uncharacterized protein LOC131198732 n=1 Tax=Ahaetulla prasina TaxID=499056 RepID=UPI002649FBEF|nr:uncharacterized protein LOC131198732 [Ahaetulla prasina]